MRIGDYIEKINELADKATDGDLETITHDDLKSVLSIKEPLSKAAVENIRKLIKEKKKLAARREKLERVKVLCKDEFSAKAEYEIDRDCIKIWPEGMPDSLKEPE